MAVVTKTLKASGGDYTLMSTWESTEQTDLVTDGDSHILECYNDWPTGLVESGVNITGWTTSATDTITVRAAAGEGHGGVVGGGFTCKRNGTAYTLGLNEHYIIVQDLQIENTDRATLNTAGYDNLIIERCICINESVGVAEWSIDFAGSISIFRNNLVITSGRGGDFGDSDLSNNTFIGTSSGTYCIKNGNSGFVKNCIIYGWGQLMYAAYNLSYTGTNLATGGGTGKVNNLTTADFVDFANDDYRISDTSPLYGAGTDLTGTFTDDIRSTATRISTSPDIGAYKFDVITKTLIPATNAAYPGDYTLMSTAESTDQQDLVALGNRYVLDCYAGEITNQCTWGGWVASHRLSNIMLKAADGEEHGGVIDAGFVMSVNDNAGTIESNQGGMDITGLQAKNSAGNGAAFSLDVAFSGVVDSCIADSSNGYGGFTGLRSVHTLRNCLASNSNVDGFRLDTSQSPVFENCTAVGCGAKGFNRNTGTGAVDLTNCVAYGNTTNDFELNTTTGMVNCASGDTTAGGTSPVTGVVAADFVDYAGGNYAAKIGGALADAGTDLSADFDDDITGTAR